MKILYVCLFIVALYLFLIWPSRASEEQKKPYVRRNFAHRGLYNNEGGIPENSIAAFRNAMEHGFGCELDVQFTKDKKLIVFHDNDYKRMCGVDKKVWELTFDEVRELRLYGTDEKIPTFHEVLETVNGQNPLIVEIKAEELNTAWYKELCEATAAELASYKGEYCVESFHPYVVRWVWKNMPDRTRGLLIDGHQEKGKETFFTFAVAELLADFYCRPQFIAYNQNRRNLALRIGQKLGAFTVMWTCRTAERQAELEKTEDCIIFERYVPDTHFAG